MEKNIKSFDRAIEQMLSRHEVQPPFGMWNRISAELDAMPAPVIPAPSASSFLSKHSIVGFIAGALIIGGALTTAYLMKQSVNTSSVSAGGIKENSTTHIKVVIEKTPVIVAPTVTPSEVNNERPSVVKMAKRMVDRKTSPLPVALAKNPSEASNLASVSAAPELSAPVLNNISGPMPVPLQAVNTENESEQYYFPPIDLNLPEKAATGSSTKVSDDKDDDDDDKKAKSSEQKIKFRPKHKKHFTYNHINRMK